MTLPLLHSALVTLDIHTCNQVQHIKLVWTLILNMQIPLR